MNTYTLTPVQRDVIFSVTTISVSPYLLKVGNIDGPVSWKKKL